MINGIKYIFLFLSVFCNVCKPSNRTSSPNRLSLYLEGFIPNEQFWPEGICSLPGAVLAVEEVNEDDNVLTDYEIVFEFNTGGCGRDDAVEHFLKDVVTKPKERQPVAIIGPGCSSAALSLASLTAQAGYEIVQISFGATSPSLSNLESFPYFLRTVPSQIVLSQALARLMIENNWTRVASLWNDDVILRSTALNFHSELAKMLDAKDAKASIESIKLDIDHMREDTGRCITDVGLQSLRESLNIIKNQRIRIIFVFVSYYLRRAIACTAKELGITSIDHENSEVKYVWVWPELYDFDWMTDSCAKQSFLCNYMMTNDSCNMMTNNSATNKSSCNMTNDSATDEPIFFLRYGLYTQYITNNTNDNFSFPNYSKRLEKRSEEMKSEQQYQSYTNSCNYTTQGQYRHPAYDAVWAVAKGLDTLDKSLKRENSSLAILLYNRSQLATMLHDYILNRSFPGPTGLVSFDKSDGYHLLPVGLWQFQKDADPSSARELCDYISNETGWSCNLTEILSWPYNDTPLDRFPSSPPQIIKPDLAIVVVVTAVTCLMLVINLFLLVCNFCFRKVYWMRQTSPALSMFIFSGNIAILLSVLIYSVLIGDLGEENNKDVTVYSVLANLTIWLFSVGYSLVLGTVALKSYRIYVIFNQTGHKKKTHLEDRWLMFGLLAIVLIGDVIPLLLFDCLSPLVYSQTPLDANGFSSKIRISLSSLPLEGIKYTEFCIYTILVLKFALALLVTFNAWQMKRANIRNNLYKIYNDSGSIFTFLLFHLVLATVTIALVLIFQVASQPSSDEELIMMRDLTIVYCTLTFVPLLSVILSLTVLFLFKYYKLGWRKRTSKPPQQAATLVKTATTTDGQLANHIRVSIDSGSSGYASEMPGSKRPSTSSWDHLRYRDIRQSSPGAYYGFNAHRRLSKASSPGLASPKISFLSEISEM